MPGGLLQHSYNLNPAILSVVRDRMGYKLDELRSGIGDAAGVQERKGEGNS